jgi:hypothetical protein
VNTRIIPSAAPKLDADTVAVNVEFRFNPKDMVDRVTLPEASVDEQWDSVRDFVIAFINQLIVGEQKLMRAIDVERV